MVAFSPFGVPVGGKGSIDLTPARTEDGFPLFKRSTAEFVQGAGPGETVTLNGTDLLLDQPMKFLATIDDVSVGPPAAPGTDDTNSSITLVGRHATSESFHKGTLTVRDDHQVVARLRFGDGLSASDFVLTNTDRGSVITIQTPMLSGGTDTTNHSVLAHVLPNPS